MGKEDRRRAKVDTNMTLFQCMRVFPAPFVIMISYHQSMLQDLERVPIFETRVKTYRRSISQLRLVVPLVRASMVQSSGSSPFHSWPALLRFP